ncbi:MAG: sugar-binding domain-containing protein [Kiritimatiellia bacterium]
MKPLAPIVAVLMALFALSGLGYEANLNVDWKFSKLAWGRGLREACANNRKDGRNVFAEDFDDSAWETVSVPHAINAHDSYDGHAVDAGESALYRGWMAYRKRVTLPQGKRFFLSFESIRQAQYVYLNGRFVGFYEAGTAPTGYDLTPFVRPGENLICLVTENTSGRGMQAYGAEALDEPGDWAGTPFQWNGSDFNPVQGGLTGNVILYVKEHEDYITLPLWANLKTKGIYVWFDGAVRVEAEVCVSGVVRAAKANEIRWSIVGLKAGERPKLWSPDTPYLYDVNVELLSADGRTVADRVTVTTGFRTVGYDKDKGILINAKPTWLPGYAQRSTSSWAAIGVAPDWLNDYDMQLVRESKANFIRWMHITPKPSLVRACDKTGVVNACPAGDKENEVTGRQWEHRVEAMRNAIIYFRNSPSILFWEAGNNRISAAHMKEMVELKKALDPTGGRFMGSRTLSDPDAIAEAEYVGTMLNRHAAKAYASMRQLNHYIPIMETEYAREESARRLWDRFTPPDFNFVCRRLASGAKKAGYNCYDLTQEEFACMNADGYQEFYGHRASGSAGKYYAACAALCWTDCNQHGRNSDTENCRSSGRVDAVRIPKESFYVHQCLYSQTPQIKILGHWNYPKKTADNYWYNEKVNDGHEIAYTGERRQRDPEHKTVTVVSSLHATEIELLANGQSVGLAKGPKKDNIFLWEFPNVDVTASGSCEAVARNAQGKVIARDRLETAGAAVKLEMAVMTGPEGWLADGADIAVVDLKLVDAKGRVLPLADDKVAFSLAFAPAGEANARGPIFMGGWNSGTFDATSPIGKDWVNLEQGVNRVFIKAGRAAGTATLTATCGAFTAEAKIPAKDVVVRGGICLAPSQGAARKACDYTVRNPVAPVRDVGRTAGAVKYQVFVNGRAVEFGTRGGAFKPDGATGVCCAYEPLLRAVKAAGADIAYTYDQKKILNKKVRSFSATPR